MKYRVLLLLGVLLSSCPVSAETRVKNITRSFPAGETTKLFVDVRFGMIDLCQWNKDSIRLEAVVELEQYDTVKAGPLLEGINLAFEHWDEVVRVTTLFGQELDTGIKIRMRFFVPENIRVDIANKYGDIDVPEYNAYQNIRLSAVYGNMNIGYIRTSADSEVSLNIAYGKMKVEGCQNAHVSVAYGDADILRATDLKVRMENSDITIVEVDSLDFEGSYNHCHVVRCSLFYATEVERSTIRLDTLNSSIYARTKDSDFTIGRVGNHFDKIDVLGMGGSYTFGLPGNKAHNLELTTDGGEVGVESLYQQESALADVDGFNRVKMYYLDNSDINPLVKVRTRDCDVRIRLVDIEEIE